MISYRAVKTTGTFGSNDHIWRGPLRETLRMAVIDREAVSRQDSKSEYHKYDVVAEEDGKERLLSSSEKQYLWHLRIEGWEIDEAETDSDE